MPINAAVSSTKTMNTDGSLLDCTRNVLADRPTPGPVRILPGQPILLARGADDALGVLVHVVALLGLKGVFMLGFALARHDDGKRYVSISQVGGVAAAAFLSRAWQPSSQHSAGDGAVSFGISMASNMGFSVVKEFLPDLVRVITKKRNHR